MANLNLRSAVTSLACASFAIMGVVSPALAQDRTVWLNENEEATVSGYFAQGETITAMCDDDCTDIDLYLYTELGVLVDSDIEDDSIPVVTAPYDGTFSIEVTMPSCSHPGGCEAYISSEQGF